MLPKYGILLGLGPDREVGEIDPAIWGDRGVVPPLLGGNPGSLVPHSGAG